MKKKDNNSHNGFYFFWGVICAVLICLKITHVINWSWGLVLLPVYGPLALVIFLAIIIAAVIASKDIDIDK